MSNPVPNLRVFHRILLNTSSGKDSQTLMRYVVRMCEEQRVERARLVAIHADLGEMEWPGCPELAGRQAVDHYGLQFMVTKRNGGDLLEYARRRGKWPSPQQRWCTSDFKRGPIRRVMTSLVRDLWRPGSGPIRILNCMGMRAQESPARAKLKYLEFDESASNSKRRVWNWLGIHEWPVEEVWSDIRKSGVPHHKAYDIGMPRLSCSFCIFSNPAALKLAGRERPELLEKYVQIEKDTGHSFQAKLKLEDIQRELLTGGCNIGPVEDWRM